MVRESGSDRWGSLVVRLSATVLPKRADRLLKDQPVLKGLNSHLQSKLVHHEFQADLPPCHCFTLYLDSVRVLYTAHQGQAREETPTPMQGRTLTIAEPAVNGLIG